MELLPLLSSSCATGVCGNRAVRLQNDGAQGCTSELQGEQTSQLGIIRGPLQAFTPWSW